MWLQELHVSTPGSNTMERTKDMTWQTSNGIAAWALGREVIIGLRKNALSVENATML